MQTGVIIGVVIYELVVILGCTFALSYMEKKKAAHASAEAHAQGKADDFVLAGRGMGVFTLATTIALTVLGSAHITGIFEMTYNQGSVSVWFSLAHVIMIVIACFCTGMWVRKVGITTVPQALKEMYGKGPSLAITCIMAGQIWGVLTLECQGVGIVIATLTGWDVQQAVIVGGILGILYVVFAGMKEVGAVNNINAIVMYIGLVVACIVVGIKLPGAYDNAKAVLDAAPETSFFTNIFGTPDLMITFAVGQIIAVTFCQSISQMLMQTFMSARSDKAIRKTVWIAAPLNGMFGSFAVALALVARSIPEYADLGAKLATTTMLVNVLPAFVSALLLAALLAAILSTFAMTSLTTATLWVNDIYRPLFRPKASPKELINVNRVMIIIVALIAIMVSTFLPTILGAIEWVFAWIVPIFWLFIFGMFWKSNGKVAAATLAVAWILNLLWSFAGLQTTVANATGLNLPNGYVTLIASLVVLIIGNLAVGKNANPAYIKMKSAQIAEIQAEMDAAELAASKK